MTTSRAAGKAFHGLRLPWEILKRMYSEWQRDKVPQQGAALAFYTVFSLAPLLILVIALGGLFFGEEAVQGRVVGEMEGLVGREGAGLIQGMIESARKPASGLVAGGIAIVTLLFGATGVFVQLQNALNTIWGVEGPPSSGIMQMVRSRFLSFLSVLGIGFLLLVSLVVNAALSGIIDYVQGWVSDEFKIAQAVHFVIFLCGITILFAMMYKLLPDLRISWRDVWIGAAVTAVLFAAGQYLVGLYLGRSSVVSAYGAAGTTVVILVWIYYAAQIFLLGAEFTYVYATLCGSRSTPEETGGERSR